MLQTWTRRSLALLFLVARPCSAVDVTGAGSTFVYPLIAKWAVAFARETGHHVNYQSIGSGGGIKQIVARTVDFGATDMPLDRAKLGELDLVQFPLIAGAVVPVVHLKGVDDGRLNLSGSVLADVFLGRIARWNDPAIAKLNPDLPLPDRRITVVHRADGSGTTFIWSTYLSSVSETWRRELGASVAIDWPTGVGGKGNEGVAAFVKLTEGAIGYVESAFVTRAHLSGARVSNRAGRFVRAEADSYRAALSHIDWSTSSNYDVSLVNAAGQTSWPVAGATFALMPARPKDADAARVSLEFFHWAYAHGGADAASLDYVPLPEPLQRRVTAEWPARFRM